MNWMPEITVNKKNECYFCVHKRPLPARDTSIIKCSKPDVEMLGVRLGVVKGHFNYPLRFDPKHKKKFCRNFQETSVDGSPEATA